MNRIISLVFLAVVSLANAAEPKQLNIVMFLVDDMRWQDTSVPFHTEVTPLNRKYHMPNNWGPKGPGIGAFSAIRQGDWKLIYYHAGQSYELFNLAADLGETKNLAAEQPAWVASLGQRLAESLESEGAQMPVVRATGKPVPLPGGLLNAKQHNWPKR